MSRISATCKYVFGYGSLLQLESLKATVPSVKSLRPVYIKGFRREFTLWDPIGWTETNLDLADIPFCGLDVRSVSDNKSLVNGITFEVSEDDLPALLEREREYELINTTAYDFDTDQPVSECMVFSANKHTGDYDFNSEAQTRYLDVCLEGAKACGEDFLNQFILTTYIGDKSLSRVNKLGLTPSSFTKRTTSAEIEIYKLFGDFAEKYNKTFSTLVLPSLIRVNEKTRKITLPYYDGETFNEKWDESNGGLPLALELSDKVPRVIQEQSTINIKPFINNQVLVSTPMFVFDHDEAKEYYGKVANKFLDAKLIDNSVYNKIIQILDYVQTTDMILSNGDFYARNFIKLPDNKLVLIDWEPWGEQTSPFYMVDHPENVAATFYVHMWGNHQWQEKYLNELRKVFNFSEKSIVKGIVIKTLGLANFWFSERSENNLTRAQLDLLIKTIEGAR